MQITIDTCKDSPEEIKKAIELLSSLTNSRISSNTDIFSSNNDTIPNTPTSNNAPTGGVFNMFSNPSSNTSTESSENKEQDIQETSKVQVLKY